MSDIFRRSNERYFNRSSYKLKVIDEIALEGLDGITLKSLWSYISLEYPITRPLQEDTWEFIKNCDCLLFYQLPAEREEEEDNNRFDNVDPDLGVPLERISRLRVSIEDGSIKGSCEYYYERIEVLRSEILDYTLQDAEDNWGDAFIIVANPETRCNAIFNHFVPKPQELPTLQYIVLEAVGRSRFNGETCSGKWSLAHYCKDPALVYFIKNNFSENGWAISQPFYERRGNHLVLTNLMMLPRFYQIRKSRLVHMIEKIHDLLKNAPNYCLSLKQIRKNLTRSEKRRSLRKIMSTDIFRRTFEIRTEQIVDLDNEDETDEEDKSESNRRTVTKIKLRDPTKSISNVLKETSNANEMKLFRLSEYKDSLKNTINDPLNKDVEIDVDDQVKSQIEIERKIEHLGEEELDKTIEDEVTQIFEDEIDKDLEQIKDTVENKMTNVDESNAECNDDEEGGDKELFDQNQIEIEDKTVNKMRTADEAMIESNSEDENDPESHSDNEDESKNVFETEVENFDEFLDKAVDETKKKHKQNKKLMSTRKGKRIRHWKLSATMPLKQQIYYSIKRHGTRGITISDLCDYTNLSYEIVRRVVKAMVKQKMINIFINDSGRQKQFCFVAIENASAITEMISAERSTIHNLQCSEYPDMPTKNIRLNDIEVISTTVKSLMGSQHLFEKQKFTSRITERMVFAVELINEKCIIQTICILKAISAIEVKKGYRDKICSKSLFRLLNYLAMKKVINFYHVVLKYDEIVKTFRYATHPKIHDEHDVFVQEILLLKHNLFLIIEEKRLRNSERKLMLEKEKEKEKEKQKRKDKSKEKEKVKETSKEEKSESSKKSKPVASSPSLALRPPKFLISRSIHELLFYISMELESDRKPINIDKDQLLTWHKTEPSLDIDSYMEKLNGDDSQMTAYSTELNWRTFIPPLPVYPDKCNRWIYFKDAVYRMPLSIFNQIFQLEKKGNKLLTEYLSHPIRQHYLLTQLPIEIQSIISRVHIHDMYILTIKVLNNMGLVQISKRSNAKDRMLFWIYINRKAEILDTTPTEASFSKVNANRQYHRMQYNFNTFHEINIYWTQLQRVCIYTKLGFSGTRTKQKKKKCRKEALDFREPVSFTEAPNLDNGITPGDKLGAAGLPTDLFAHRFRHWSWVIHAKSKVTVKKGRTKLNKGNVEYVRKVCADAKKRLAIKCLRQERSTVKRGGRKKLVRDAIDRDAMKNMRTLRVKWKETEDLILKYSRAVYAYIAAPIADLGLLTISKICRDILRHSVGSNNKTSHACLRRSQFLMRKARHVPVTSLWLHRLHADEYMQRNYGEKFLTNLKKVYSSRSKYCDALAKHYIKIFIYLFKLISLGKEVDISKFNMPNTIEEFKMRFVEHSSTPDEDILQDGDAEQLLCYANPKTEMELNISIVIQVLHSSLCCSRDKTLFNMQCFEIYKHYSEDILHAAFTKARADALVVAVKRKYMELIPNQLAAPAYLLSSRYRFRLSFMKIAYSMFDGFYAFYDTILQKSFGTKACSSFVNRKKSFELKSPHIGQFIFIAEALNQNLLEANIKLPLNILTVDIDNYQSGSSMDRTLDHYHIIFDNAPQTEYSKNYENENNDKQPHVRFYPANLSYKLQYSPYDFISKLPCRYMHFFCALDNINETVNINLSKLYHKDDDEPDVMVMDCPFNCIMKSDNYINEIERIIQEKESILKELLEVSSARMIDKQLKTNTSIKLTPQNFFTIIDKLESFWHEKEINNHQKDLGKLSPTLKFNSTLNWHELCLNLLEFNPNDDDLDKFDEFEPQMSKEDRMSRAHDVFAINLPTLQYEFNFQDKTFVNYNSMTLPTEFVGSALIKEQILKKIVSDSIWIRTSNTFETLKQRFQALNLSKIEQSYVLEVHNYIELNKLGVTAQNLLIEFPAKNLLLQAIRLLCDHELIKRLGVASIMYVHKNHIRPWVVHTFHIKRLEREKLRCITDITVSENPTNENLAIDQEMSATSSSKQRETVGENRSLELTDSEPPPKRRRCTTVKNSEFESQDVVRNEVHKEIVIMIPHPWMRLNGSLNRRVLDKLLGSVLIQCLTQSGCLVHSVCLKFPHFLPMDIMLLLELLWDLKCIELIEMEKTETIDIFSNYDTLKESPATELYDPTQTYIVTHPDAVTRFATFLGQKKYLADYI